MRGGAFFNGKEGRVGFRKKPFLMVKKDGMILEIPLVKGYRNSKNNMIIGRRSINNNDNFKATFSVDVELTFKKQDK